MHGNVTIIDVAEKTGLSKSAVAYALSHNAKGKVSQEKRLLIEAAAKELGYSANISAKRLRSGKSRAIGVLMPAPTSAYYGEMVIEIQRLLAQRSYAGVFSFFDSLGEGKRAANQILSQQVDGIITFEPTLLPEGLGIPVVASCYDCDVRFDCIHSDFPHMLDSLLDYLTALGHIKIGYIAYRNDAVRTSHFIKSLARRNLPFSPSWLYLNPRKLLNYELGYQGLEAIFKSDDKPSAVWAHNDHAAIGAMRKAWEMGVDVPGQLSIAGYDDLPQAAYHRPSLTTFRHSEGKSAAKLLLELLFNRINEPGIPQQRRLLKPRLIKRESCAKHEAF